MHACIILYTHGFHFLILTAPESAKITNLHQKIDFDQYADFITVNVAMEGPFSTGTVLHHVQARFMY